MTIELKKLLHATFITGYMSALPKQKMNGKDLKHAEKMFSDFYNTLKNKK